MRQNNSCILLLAAGSSTRFGCDKRHAVLPDGQTMLDRMLSTVQSLDHPYRLIVRTGDRLLQQYPFVIEAPNAGAGMGNSIADGVSQLDEYSSVLLLPLDLPLLRPESIRSVLRSASDSAIVVPVCDQRRGHPVAFGSAFYPQLRALAGEGGGKAIVEANPDCVLTVSVDDPGIYLDADTPRRLQELFSHTA